jgi:hypothetical protein
VLPPVDGKGGLEEASSLDPSIPLVVAF